MRGKRVARIRRTAFEAAARPLPSMNPAKPFVATAIATMAMFSRNEPVSVSPQINIHARIARRAQANSPAVHR